MTDGDFDRRLEQARRTNRERDQADRKHGHTAPSDCPLVVHARTAREALQCGVLADDRDALFRRPRPARRADRPPRPLGPPTDQEAKFWPPTRKPAPRP